MEPTRTLPLALVRTMVIVVYGAALVTYPAVGAAVTLRTRLAPQTAQLVGLLLLSLAVLGYVLSLWLERFLLGLARDRQKPQSVTTSAIGVAAIGETMAIFGLLLSLLGAGAWALPLYALCLLHGIHLALRWPDYEQAASSEPL